jgi:hypothetical protein
VRLGSQRLNRLRLSLQMLAFPRELLRFLLFDFKLRAADVEGPIEREPERLQGNTDASDASPEMVSWGVETAALSWRR